MKLTRFIATAVFTIGAAGTLAACDNAADETAVSEEGSVAASGVDTSVIEQRQDNFEEIGDSFKVIRDQMDTDAPDFAVILAAAETIEADATKILDFFPEGTGMDSGADTEALASIWERPDEFAAAHGRLTEAAAGLVAAAEAGDPAGMGPAIGELGSSCKNCHDNFRLDDE